MLPDVRIRVPSGTPSGGFFNRFNNFDGLTAFDAFSKIPATGKVPDVRIRVPSGTSSGSFINRFNNFDGLTAFDAFL